jgi:hypothetical protein
MVDYTNRRNSDLIHQTTKVVQGDKKGLGVRCLAPVKSGQRPEAAECYNLGAGSPVGRSDYGIYHCCLVV